jgi:LPS sulfotransferase NodH
MWQWFFEKHSITPHCVIYEELVAEYETTLRGVMRFLGVSYANKDFNPPITLRQADALSEEWNRRYLEQRAAHGL